jgi:hypothetical protein
LLVGTEAASARNRLRGVPTGLSGSPLPSISTHLPGQVVNRPELIDYNPVANSSAVVFSSDKMARFTVLTSRLLRMEYARVAGDFEDLATIAIMNRDLEVPAFTALESGGTLTITTTVVKLTYIVGQPFTASSLLVVSVDSNSAFQSWMYGDPFPGNLLGTIRGLDGQDNT